VEADCLDWTTKNSYSVELELKLSQRQPAPTRWGLAAKDFKFMKQYTLIMYAGSMPKTPLYFRHFDSEGFAITNRDKKTSTPDSLENILSTLGKLNESDKEAFGKLEISLYK
jgi:hypothetical protein